MNKLITLFIVFIFSFSFAQEFPIPNYSGPVYDFGNSFSDRVEQVDNQFEMPLWSTLEQLTLDEKSNSIIEFEGKISDPFYLNLQKVALLWNNGNAEAALNLLKSFNRNELNKFTVGINWKSPHPTLSKPNWGTDVRIGDRDSIDLVKLTYEKSTGNLFAVLSYKENNTYAWSINLSTDGGLTWSETYEWNSTVKIYSVSTTVVGSYCYVAYATVGHPREGRIRRFNTSNGQSATFPDASGYISVVTVADGDSVEEVVVSSNQTDFNNRLYYAVTTASDSILMFWNNPVDVLYNKFGSNLNDVKEGLDLCRNNDFNGFNYVNYNFGSYISTDNSIKIFGIDDSDSLKVIFTFFPGFAREYSSISSQNDTITCVFTYYAGVTKHNKYVVSYNGGSTWNYGLIGDSTTTSESPDIAAGDAGVGVIYRYYTPQRQGRFIWRPMKGAWSTPVQYSDNEPYYNKPALEYLGNRKFGVVYLSWINPVFRGAFFDLEDITPVDVQDDLAKTPDTYKLLQNYPNPFNPTTLIRYELPSQSFVTIKIYDALGNLVDELVNEEKSAGAYEVIFNASKLSSGVYFYSLQAGSFIQTNRMLLLR